MRNKRRGTNVATDVSGGSGSLIAYFTTQYYLTTSVNDPSQGTVTPSGWYAQGQVTITATPNAGYDFDSYSGALTGTVSSQVLTVTGPAGVAAEFHSLANHGVIFSTTTNGYGGLNNGTSARWTYCVTYSGSSCGAGSFDAHNVSGCVVSGGNVTVQSLVAGTFGEKYNFDVTFSANHFAVPGPRSLVCTYNGMKLVLGGALTVYDATPVITGISQSSPSYSGGPFNVTLSGTNFGPATGSTSACAHATGSPLPPCNGTADLTVSAPNAWSDTSVTVTLTPSLTAGGAYDLVLNSLGESGAGFQPEPSVSQAQSNRARITVTTPQMYTISGVVTAQKTGSGVAGITITLADGNNNNTVVGTAVTGADGSYSARIAAGGSYTITPAGNPFGTYFTPASAYFANVSSNMTEPFTLAPIRTAYLLHGIGQGAVAMQQLYNSLVSIQGGVDQSRTQFDVGFDYSACAAAGPDCPSNCGISDGAQQLASYIASQNPPGDIIFIGYSMGGLIARDLIANNYGGVLSGRGTPVLITLGTPNLGYPELDTDKSGFCPALIDDMGGYWNPSPSQPPNAALTYLSPYLQGLASEWQAAGYSGSWITAPGLQCSNPNRFVAPGIQSSLVGCRSSSNSSDGVVCRDSVAYSDPVYAIGPGPSQVWFDSQGIYVHTTTLNGYGSGLVLCPNDPNRVLVLNNPPIGDSLFSAIRDTLNNGHFQQ